MGNALQDLGRLEEAKTCYQRSLQIKPDYAEVHNNLGNTLANLGQLDNAIACIRRALEINPDYPEAHNSMGSALITLGKFDEALTYCQRALMLKPDSADAYNNSGLALIGLGQIDDAAASCRRAVEIKPQSAQANCNLANIQIDLGQYDHAIASNRRALEIKPDFFEAHSNLLFTFNYMPNQPITTSVEEALRFGDSVARHATPYTDWPNDPTGTRRLRIGLVSGDLRNHPVGFFVEGFLASLASDSTNNLDLVAYSNHFSTDSLANRIKSYCQEWHMVVGLSDENLARLIRADAIDILIDLSGHTAHNRLPMFAWKPAPVQVSWLGNLATTGVASIDYVIADDLAVPKTDDGHFTEKIWRLPESCLCFTPQVQDADVSDLPAMTNGFVTFGSFNKLTKMNDAVVALWARVLHAVPGSRLYLKDKQLGQPQRRQSVIDRFAQHYIPESRLDFEGYSVRSAQFSYRKIDIALDPFPYSGVTTTVEALWMGVPVLTLMGDRFLARIGASILHHAGLSEWIAADADDYVSRAARHAEDLQTLVTLRHGLREQVLHSPIFDSRRFAQNFSMALRGMWTQWCEQYTADL